MAYMNYGEDKPEFNMAVMFLTRLDNRLSARDLAAVRGDMFTWYRENKRIYNTIHFKIKESKDDELINNKIVELFEKIKNLLAQKGGSKALQNQAMIMSISVAEIELDKLDLILNNLMYKYHLIFPKKRETNPGEAVRDFF